VTFSWTAGQTTTDELQSLQSLFPSTSLFHHLSIYCFYDARCSRAFQSVTSDYLRTVFKTLTTLMIRSLFLILLHGKLFLPSVLRHCWLDMGCWYHVCKTKDDQTTGFSCSALTLHYMLSDRKDILLIKNPVVVPVSLSFVRAPAHLGYPGSKGSKTVVHSTENYFIATNPQQAVAAVRHTARNSEHWLFVENISVTVGCSKLSRGFIPDCVKKNDRFWLWAATCVGWLKGLSAHISW